MWGGRKKNSALQAVEQRKVKFPKPDVLKSCFKKKISLLVKGLTSQS